MEWTWHHPSRVFFFLFSISVLGGGVRFWLHLPSICPAAALSLLSVSLLLCHSPSLSLLYDLGYSVSSQSTGTGGRKKKKNRRSNLWRTSLLKCATFYFSANYPHAVHRLKAELWLSLSARLRPWHVVLSECHSNRGTRWSSVLILNNFCSFFFFFTF